MRKALPVVMAIVLLPLFAAAQEKKEEPKPEMTSRAYLVKPGNTDRIVETVRNILGSDAVKGDRNAGVVLVRAPRDVMSAIDQMVTSLDATARAPTNVEVTLYALLGMPGVNAPGPVPADLQPAIAQLKSVFAYQSFYVMEVAFLRGRVGDWVRANGLLSLPKEKDSPSEASYQVGFRPSISSASAPRSIRLDGLYFNVGMRIPVRIEGNIDVKEGQKVVVGKTGVEGQRALILVVSAKIVD